MSNNLTEQKCLNALHGRVIKKIDFSDDFETEIKITTHDNLVFKLSSITGIAIKQEK